MSKRIRLTYDLTEHDEGFIVDAQMPERRDQILNAPTTQQASSSAMKTPCSPTQQQVNLAESTCTTSARREVADVIAAALNLPTTQLLLSTTTTTTTTTTTLPAATARARASPALATTAVNLDTSPRVVTRMPVQYSLFSLVTPADDGEPFTTATMTTTATPTTTANTFPFYCSVIACHSIHNNARQVAVLTKLPLGNLPPLQLLYDETRTLPSPTTLANPLQLSAKQFNLAGRYTLRVFAFCHFEREYQSAQLPYLILPALLDGQVDWREVTESFERPDLMPLGDTDLLRLASAEDLGALGDRIVYQGHEYWKERPLCPVALHVTSTKGEPPKPPLLSHWTAKFDKEVDPSGSSGLSTPTSPSTPAATSPRNSPRKNKSGMLLEVCSIPRATDMRQLDRKTLEIRQVTVVPTSCHVGAMSASMLRSARMMPSILTAYEHILMTRECNKDILGGLIKDCSILQEALTTPLANRLCNYQRLEFLGDCVLKFIASCVVFSQNDDTEGVLTVKRMRMICNAHLHQISLQLCLAEYANGQDTFPKRWIAHNLCDRTVRMSGKMRADLIESILGAAWLDGGLDSALACCNRLSIFDETVDCEYFARTHAAIAGPPPSMSVFEHEVAWPFLDDLQRELGYTFRSPHLARQAFTHSSVKRDDLPSYERLEFLGDAVLDVCVVQLLHRMYNCLTEEGFTRLKSFAVSNISLGVACLTTKLPRFLVQSTGDMAPRITAFDAKVQQARATAANAAVGAHDGRQEERRKTFFWHGLADAPKQLADVVESTMGAVLVDSGFDLEIARGVFDTLFKSHFETFFHPSALPTGILPLPPPSLVS